MLFLTVPPKQQSLRNEMVYGARVEKTWMELAEARDTAHPHCRLQFVVQDCEERIISNIIGNRRIIRIVKCVKTLDGGLGRADI